MPFGMWELTLVRLPVLYLCHQQRHDTLPTLHNSLRTEETSHLQFCAVTLGHQKKNSNADESASTLLVAAHNKIAIGIHIRDQTLRLAAGGVEEIFVDFGTGCGFGDGEV